MATLSLREIAESQLDDTPIIDGQLVCCLDTGRFYRDTGSERVELEVDIICVSSLPLAPITNKFYLVIPDTLYFYDGTEFYELTHPNIIEKIQENGADLEIEDKTVNISVPTKVSELDNDAGYITEDTNITYVLKSSKSSENGEVIIELENSEGGSDVIQITGDGNTTVTTDEDGIITIATVDENGNTYAEAPYDNGPASRVVLEDGEASVDSTFYLPFISESDSALLSSDGILYNTFTSEYDADSVARLGEGILGKMVLGGVGYYNGYANLILGNDIPAGTAGNKYGAIQIYSAESNYWTIYGNKEISENYILFIPSATGCLIVAQDQVQTGDETTPVYITSDGMATGFSKTVGSTNQPVYMNQGAITAITDPLSTVYGGTGTNLGHIEIDMDGDTESLVAPGGGETFTTIDEITRDDFGHITSLNTKTILLPVNSITSTAETVGSATQPVYLNDNVITAMDGALAIEYGGTGTKVGHIEVIFAENTDSSETLNPGESFTTIDGITKDDFGHITKVNVKTVQLSGETFADTKVTQELTKESDDYPILLAPAGQTETTTTSAYFATAVQANPSTGELIASKFVGDLSGNADSATIATNAEVAEKVGTINIGNDATPIYIVSGTPTAISETIGSSAQPVYLNSGAITPIGDSIGSSERPVYLDNGVIKPIGTLSILYGGTGTSTGHIAIDTSNASADKTVIQFGGSFDVIDSISLDSFGFGHVTTYNVKTINMPTDTIGDGTNVIYFDGGVPKISGKTVGAVNKPIWLNSGTFEEITQPIAISMGGTGTETGHCEIITSKDVENSKEVELGGVMQVISGVNRDEYGHALYCTFDTITLSRVIPLELMNPSTETTYYLPFSENAESVLGYNDGIKYTSSSPEYNVNSGSILGTAILGQMVLGSNGYIDGYALLTLGNNISYGVAGNKYGELRLYGAGTNYWTVNGDKRITSNYVLFLPESNGCLVVAHDDEETGNDVNPVYIAANGEVTASTGTVGSDELPVYLNKGTITAMSKPLSPIFGGTGTSLGHIEIQTTSNTSSTEKMSFGDAYTFDVIDSITLDDSGFGHVVTYNVKTMAMPTTSAGSGTNPIYFSGGVPTASGSTVGGLTQPIWLNGGIITAISQTIGDSAQPIYMNNGVITAITQTVGGSTQPVYMNNGVITAISQTIGSGSQPVYINNGAITAISQTIGDSARAVYINNGVITALTGTVGSSTQPVYMSNGAITAINSTIGATAQPVYVNSGTLTAITQTVGSTSRPVWLNGGVITAMSSQLSVEYGGTGTSTGHCSVALGTDSTNTETISLGDTFNTVSSLTKDSNGHVLSVSTITNTLSTNVPLTLTQPSNETDYYVTFSEGSDKVLRYNDGIQYHTYESQYVQSASAALGSLVLGSGVLGCNGWVDGQAVMVLGNSIASGNEGNKYGAVKLYSNSASTAWTITGQKKASSNYTLTLPLSSGCLVVASDGDNVGDKDNPVYINSNGVANVCDELYPPVSNDEIDALFANDYDDLSNYNSNLTQQSQSDGEEALLESESQSNNSDVLQESDITQESQSDTEDDETEMLPELNGDDDEQQLPSDKIEVSQEPETDEENMPVDQDEIETDILSKNEDSEENEVTNNE